MKDFFLRAVSNIVKHGDTDIFPFPIENHVLFDKGKEIVDLLLEIDSDFSEQLTRYPPSNYSALAPISYSGFRWATQIDPLWNAYFLGLVISISEQIETARLPTREQIIFSYRYSWNEATSDLFDKNYNWRSFMEQSITKAKSSKWVVSCDISEFYPRLNHHRLENALRQLKIIGDQPKKIMAFLANFSGTYSFGIPVGGPAARILSELLLNQIDRLLKAEGIDFCRFADDFHLFCDSQESSIKALLFLSERLVVNQGLQLQKAKTRIMSGQEFIATNPLTTVDSEDGPAARDAPALREQSQNFLRFSVRFDPYSPTAMDDYEALKEQLQRYDIISLLRAELSKSRIHISLSKKIVSAIRFIGGSQRDDAVLSLISNADLLYPIYSNVLLVAKSIFHELKSNTQKKIVSVLLMLFKANSHVLQPELNLAYAVRVLSSMQTPEIEEVLNRIFQQTRSIVIRRDIILTMAKWGAWYWLSNLKPNFRTLTPPERRAFIIASYALSDEGGHWRTHIQNEFSPFEKLVKDWAAEKSQMSGWSIPI